MICNRCRIKKSDFICNECKSALCFQCDGFVHSSLKRFHNREKISSPQKINSNSSDQNTNYETNLNFYTPLLLNKDNINRINERINEKEEDEIKYLNLKNELNTRYKNNNISNISQDRLFKSYNNGFNEETNNNLYNINNCDGNIISNRTNIPNDSIVSPLPNLSSRYVKQIKEVYEQERKGLISKINQLTQELKDTNKNLSERIDYLHRHLYEIESKHRNELSEAKNKSDIETKKLEEEKNIKINKLQNIINSQNSTINELKESIKNLQNTMSEKESSYLKKDRDADNIINEKESLENYYKNEIEQIKKKHNEEKLSLISEYEHVINQISAELDINKKNYLNALKEIKERENMIQNVVDNANNEKELMNNNLIKLKEQNTQDQKKLMKLNSELKNESENKTEQIEQLRTEIKNLSEENEKMKSKVKKMRKLNSEKKISNTKMNNIIVKNKFSKK